MKALNTRWFSSSLALTLLIACDDAAGSPRDDTPDPVDQAELDAGKAADARSATRLDATATTDARASGDAAVRPTGEDAAVQPTIDAATSTGKAACTVTASNAHCTSRAIVQLGVASDRRDVYWALPTTPPPAQGYPAVILYQGSLFGPSTTWNVDTGTSTPFGGMYQVILVAKLLEHGYAVVQPAAPGELYWSTNNTVDYPNSADGVFIPKLLDAMAAGTFGPLDTTHMFATGISSGGYMTSRMAVSYPGRFRALAIESGSYATCAGPICFIPSKLPADHPPTLFLHGAVDTTVPMSTAESYDTALKAQGIETEFIRDPNAGHEWLSSAPDAIPRWFDTHAN